MSQVASATGVKMAAPEASATAPAASESFAPARSRFHAACGAQMYSSSSASPSSTVRSQVGQYQRTSSGVPQAP